MQSTIRFYGGAGIVTGSHFLLETSPEKSGQFLIDCGLTQGTPDMEARNWEPFPYAAKEMPFLIITHAHIDHIGRIPKLVHDGFRGRIISTEATKALAEPMLMNAYELLSHSAQHYQRPLLYEKEDITEALKLWEGIPYHHSVQLSSDVSVELLCSGHILGSAMARFTRGGVSVVFTGDLGGGNSPLLPLAETLSNTSYLIMESVYGDRTRSKEEQGDRQQQLADIIAQSAKRGGTLLIPAFSAERTQDLLFDIRELMMHKRIPSMPVYLDSPLAEKITDAYMAQSSYFAPAIHERIEKGENIFGFPELRWIAHQAQSSELQHAPNPKIILAGSGMSNGGRAIAHETHLLPDASATVLITGYQAPGTLGRRIVDGAKNVTIYGKEIPVHCKVEHMYNYSAHMDSEALLAFVEVAHASLKEVFVVMGEPASSAFLSQRIRDYLGVHAVTPETGAHYSIEL